MEVFTAHAFADRPSAGPDCKLSQPPSLRIRFRHLQAKGFGDGAQRRRYVDACGQEYRSGDDSRATRAFTAFNTDPAALSERIHKLTGEPGHRLFRGRCSRVRKGKGVECDSARGPRPSFVCENDLRRGFVRFGQRHNDIEFGCAPGAHFIVPPVTTP